MYVSVWFVRERSHLQPTLPLIRTYSCINITWRNSVCNGYDPFMCIIDVRDMTRSYSLKQVRRLVHVHNHICDIIHGCMWHHHLLFMTWCIDVCDIDGSNVWHDSLMYVTRLIHTHWGMWQYPSICMTRRIDVCDMTHPYTWHNAFINVRWLIQYVTWLMDVCDVTYSYIWHDALMYVSDSFVYMT